MFKSSGEMNLQSVDHIFSLRRQRQQAFGRQWEGRGKTHQPRFLPLFPIGFKDADTKLNSVSHAVIQDRSVRYIPERVFTGML